MLGFPSLQVPHAMISLALSCVENAVSTAAPGSAVMQRVVLSAIGWRVNNDPWNVPPEKDTKATQAIRQPREVHSGAYDLGSA